MAEAANERKNRALVECPHGAGSCGIGLIVTSNKTTQSEERLGKHMQGDRYREQPDFVLQDGGVTVRVFSPILTAEERARRMKRIYEAAQNLLLEEEKLRLARC